MLTTHIKYYDNLDVQKHVPTRINMEANTYSSLNEVQKAVDDWIVKVGGGYFSELTNMVVLTEEVGELARVIARVYGDQVAKQGDLGADAHAKLSEELADVLWVVACLANQTGVNLTDAFAATLAKKTKRDANRFKK